MRGLGDRPRSGSRRPGRATCRARNAGRNRGVCGESYGEGAEGGFDGELARLKSEIRGPKSERNPKSESRITSRHSRKFSGFFRASDFGLRICPYPFPLFISGQCPYSRDMKQIREPSVLALNRRQFIRAAGILGLATGWGQNEARADDTITLPF